jgi:hypothetical protein
MSKSCSDTTLLGYQYVTCNRDSLGFMVCDLATKNKKQKIKLLASCIFRLKFLFGYSSDRSIWITILTIQASRSYIQTVDRQIETISTFTKLVKGGLNQKRWREILPLYY